MIVTKEDIQYYTEVSRYFFLPTTTACTNETNLWPPCN